MTESNQLHISYRGQQMGPMDLQSVNAALSNGVVGADAMAWYEGLDTWIAISQVEGVRLGVVTGMPPPLAYPAAYQNIGYPGVGYPSDKSKIGYIVLVIFLGTLGIHNFYAGFTGQGLAQLLITVFLFWTVIAVPIVWIWAIVNVCTVDTDALGRPFSS